MPQMPLDRIAHGSGGCLTCSGPELSRLRALAILWLGAGEARTIAFLVAISATEQNNV